MALKRCVTVDTPRSNASCDSCAVAFVWPADTTTPLSLDRDLKDVSHGYYPEGDDHGFLWRTNTFWFARETPGGNQIDLVEVMDVEDGKIKHHRVYWGWFGFQRLLRNAAAKAGTLGTMVDKIMATLKPEAAYFYADDDGQRRGGLGAAPRA